MWAFLGAGVWALLAALLAPHLVDVLGGLGVVEQ
jgi:hypothetical protein